MDDQAQGNSQPISQMMAGPSRAEAIALLSSCLMLVRPGNMGDEAVKEWLAVASLECRDIPIKKLKDACKYTRRKATQFGQIIPTIFAYLDENSFSGPA